MQWPGRGSVAFSGCLEGASPLGETFAGRLANRRGTGAPVAGPPPRKSAGARGRFPPRPGPSQPGSGCRPWVAPARAEQAARLVVAPLAGRLGRGGRALARAGLPRAEPPAASPVRTSLTSVAQLGDDHEDHDAGHREEGRDGNYGPEVGRCRPPERGLWSVATWHRSYLLSSGWPLHAPSAFASGVIGGRIGKWQATKWSSPIFRMTGSSVAHLSEARGHLVR